VRGGDDRAERRDPHALAAPLALAGAVHTCDLIPHTDLGRVGLVAHGEFDSEALGLMQVALEHAWAALPPDQRTAETRERIAQAVVKLAMHWERDPMQPGAISPAERARISLSVN
jgi:hypothetical protein